MITLGKINDIYNGEGITEAESTADNTDSIEKMLQTMNRDFHGLTFLNLFDFDSKYGHRRNTKGYGDALEVYDQRFPEILDKMNEDDLMIITADHGNNPIFSGTDHTLELVPLLIYYPNIKQAYNLDVRNTFADVGATIAENFRVNSTGNGVRT